MYVLKLQKNAHEEHFLFLEGGGTDIVTATHTYGVLDFTILCLSFIQLPGTCKSLMESASGAFIKSLR